MLLFATMAVRDGGGKKKSSGPKLPTLKPGPKPTAKVGKPTKRSAADKAATAKANKNPQFTGKNVPVVKSTSMSLRGMQGSSSFQPTKGQIAKAAAVIAGLGAATGYQIVRQTVVSEATKKLQRSLSKEMRSRSDKDIRSMPKAKRDRIAESRHSWDDASPDEYIEWRDIPNQMRRDISESMKNTSKKKTTLRKLK